MRKKEIEEALNIPLSKEQFISEVETLVRRDEMGYVEAKKATPQHFYDHP